MRTNDTPTDKRPLFSLNIGRDLAWAKQAPTRRKRWARTLAVYSHYVGLVASAVFAAALALLVTQQ